MMKRGKYWIGDLCYVMHDRWDEFCDMTICEHTCSDGEFRMKDGTALASYGTQYGDGLYLDNYGNRYPVDAGLIGCIKVEDADIGGAVGLGHIYSFDKPFRTGRTPDGTIYFGHVRIPTGDEEEAVLDNDQGC